jgi:hypothetical protein
MPRHFDNDLPHIIVELREWASLRERIILRCSDRLMEFPSVQALQVGLSQGFTGSVVADRFILLDANSASNISGFPIINYPQPLPKNLSITETGMIRIRRGTHDLLTAAQLTQWANRKADVEWQLTAESISNALRPGRKITELREAIALSQQLMHVKPSKRRTYATKSKQVS